MRGPLSESECMAAGVCGGHGAGATAESSLLETMTTDKKELVNWEWEMRF